jgi:hypothetical protein
LKSSKPEERRIFYIHSRANAFRIQKGDNLSHRGVDHLSDRIIAITNPGDVVIIHPDDSQHLHLLLSHIKSMDIPFSRDIRITESFPPLDEVHGAEISTFMFDDDVCRLTPDVRCLSVVKEMNNKNVFIKLCRALGIRTPHTYTYMGKNELRRDTYLAYPFYLKLAISIMGNGVFLCKDRHDLIDKLTYIDENIAFQLQEEIRSVEAFINVQYHIVEDGVPIRFLITEQILDGNSHSGNVYRNNSLWEGAWNVTDPLAAILAARNMKGFFAFDLAVSSQKDSIQYLPIECNPRWNGSTYPAMIARKLCITGCWTSKWINVGHRFDNAVDLGELQYSKEKKEGVIIYSLSKLHTGKALALIIGNDEVRMREYESSLCNDFCVRENR